MCLNWSAKTPAPRMRVAPPRPAPAVRTGLPQRGQQQLRRVGQPVDEGRPVLGRGGELDRGPRGGGPGGDDAGPAVASLADVPGQVAQLPLRTARHLRVEARSRGDDLAEGGGPFVDQTQQIGEPKSVVHCGCLPLIDQQV